MFLALWGKITGADQDKEYPIQQASFLGRIGDQIIVFPYGFYADLPDDVALRAIAKGLAVSVTKNRTSDLNRGEPVFYHPVTGARMIARNDGSWEIIPANGEPVKLMGDFEITGNLSVAGETALGAVVTSDGKDISDTHGHAQNVDSAGDTQANISGVT